MKIVFCGSHGTGKTTLAERVCGFLNSEGTTQFKLIVNSTREAESVFEDVWKDGTVNECSILGYRLCKWRQAKDNWICDRSLLDSLIYATIKGTLPDQTLYLLTELVRWSFQFIDCVIYIPISIDLVGDEYRPDDFVYQRKIDEGLRAFLTEVGIEHHKLESVELDERVRETVEYIIRRS